MSPAGAHLSDALNDLIEACKDSEAACRHGYEHAQAAALKQGFLARAESWRANAIELQGWVSQLGGDPEDSGTLAAALQRGWISAKGALGGVTALDLLDEVDRAEAAALARYRTALGTAALPAEVRAVVARQHEHAEREHARLGAMCNGMPGAAG